MPNCPSEATLRLVGTEAVGEVTFAGLEAHVEQCPDCQRILEDATRAVPRATQPAPTRNVQPALPGLVIERELGRGGASVVYLAWEPALKRHVAVKLLARNSLVDPHAREHWLAEARALSRVPHDHVVAIHRVDETEEWLWLVLEFVSGGTLKDRLTEPLLPRDAARLTETIARAVGYFHTRGLSHLDLKPSNILLDGEPGAAWDAVSPKISDFGIARLEGEPGATRTGANGPKGTPSYMAPEQVADVPGTIGHAADLYALGALLYHLLTGRPPFQGASDTETLDQVLKQDPAPPRRINGRIPRDLETICLKCLEKAPNGRYGTAEALAGDLRLWLEGRPIRARRVSPVGHAWRWCRRHPAVAGLLATLAMTVATGVVGLFVLLNQVEAERSRLAVARRHAEAYEQFTSRSADQVTSFVLASFPYPQDTAPDERIATLRSLRDSIDELKRRGVVPSSALGILETKIGWHLMYEHQNEEARDLYEQAAADLKQSLAITPEDTEARFSLGKALFFSGILAEDAGQLDAGLNFYEQSAACLLRPESGDSKLVILLDFYKKMRAFADRLGQGNQAAREDRARRLSQQIFRHLFGSDHADSADASDVGVEMLRRLFQSDEFKKWTSRIDIRAKWLAFSVEPLSPFHSPSSAASFDRDPEAGAFALISALRDRCSRLDLAESMVPVALDVVREDAAFEAAEWRHAGRLDDAHATAARLMTIAQRVVREYPDSAHSYRMLCGRKTRSRKTPCAVATINSSRSPCLRRLTRPGGPSSWTLPSPRFDKLWTSSANSSLGSRLNGTRRFPRPHRRVSPRIG